MNWENIGHYSEEGDFPDAQGPHHSLNSIHEQNERKRVAQLEKLINIKNNEHRKAYMEIMTKFGELLVENNKEEIANTLLTENSEIFLINYAEISPIEYASNHHKFISLLRGYRTIQREVKETFIDLNLATGFQMCYCTILNEKEGLTLSQFSSEVFSFKGNKISKYRAAFGTMPAVNEPQNLFVPSTKEKMLIKVKELNYAWADQPNFDKIASLLDQKTEYKIWRWKDKKCFTFSKDNLASEFRKNLEEDYTITSIVPFDPSCEAQYVVASYVYYLEGKGELSGNRYQWMSNCIYAFDKDGNLSKISHQGEIYKQDDILIPFEVNSEERIKEKISAIYELPPKKSFSVFSIQEMNFSFDIGIFGCSTAYYSGIIKGFNEYKKILMISERRTGEFKMANPLSLYLDLDCPCHDTAITIDCTQPAVKSDDPLVPAQKKTLYCLRKFSFENERIAKIILFVFILPGEIPSLCDDFDFPNSNLCNDKEVVQM